MDRKQFNTNHSMTDIYFREENVLEPPSNRYIFISLSIALILNFLPLQDQYLIFYPDFVAITIMYWCINSSHKVGMTIAFILGLMMDVGNTSILGQHALAYCFLVYFTLIFGRRLRLFNSVQQAPQIGFILFIMQLVIVLVALLSGAVFPGWHYFLATVTSALVWVPASFLLSLPLRQKEDPNAL